MLSRELARSRNRSIFNFAKDKRIRIYKQNIMHLSNPGTDSRLDKILAPATEVNEVEFVTTD